VAQGDREDRSVGCKKLTDLLAVGIDFWKNAEYA